ncbi:MAG TPA: AAA family ATPase [Stenomitos sp.]
MEADIPPLIQQMQQPGFYPHPVEKPIRLLQTHISYVLLAGDYAYKVKKPVNFGFLDFTTLEKRHDCCQTELRLNRRLSPDLYLAVLPIAEVAGRYHFATSPEEADQIVEYAVQMRQFSQDLLFSHLLKDGHLTPELVQQLGRAVANFHAQAETNPEIQTYGSVAAIRRVDDNNFNLSQPFIGSVQTQSQYEETRAFTSQYLTTHADWIEQRQAEDKVRECHGDLHLNNVCLYEDAICIFDCIEFNREFRNIDVIYDAAFLIMDLEFQGRRDLANLFLNTYLEHTGDYEGAKLLPLYLTMRAYIRANVNAFALQDTSIPESEKLEFRQRSADYYHLAWTYTRRSPGYLILMCGVSGSGKSTVARQLAQRLHALHLRSDAVRKHLANIPLYASGAQAGNAHSGIYTAAMTEQTYRRLQELGLQLAQQGWPVILDAKYDRYALRQSVIEAAQAAQVPLRIVMCNAPLDVLEQRLRSRQGDISDATLDLLATQLEAAEPLLPQEQTLATLLHTEQPLDAQLAPLLSQLNTGSF